MDTETLIYQAIESIVGISREDFADYQDTNLLESGIFDSLSIVSVLTEISRLSGKTVGVSCLKASFFTSIGAFVDAMKAVLA